MTISRDHAGYLTEVLNQCIHCGMCLPVCPTYALTLREDSSPRGRIRLMRSVEEEVLPLGREFVREMYFCLDCQACQTACPAGVKYGVLVEHARTLISDRGKGPFGLRMVKGILLWILRSKRRIRLAAWMLRWYEKTGLRAAVEGSAVLTVFSPSLQARHDMLPKATPVLFEDEIPELLPAYGMKRGRVGFLTGCIMNACMSDVHRASVEVLRRNGFELVIPKDQVCCGSLHAHNGEVRDARELARQNIGVFLRCGIDAIVVDSAGCSAFMKDYGRLFPDDDDMKLRAREMASQVREITEFLSERGIGTPNTTACASVTYHDACHLVHAQGISRQPRELIRGIPGLVLVELPESTWCCGSAGIYNITQHEESMKLLDRKVQHIASTGARIVVTANPGCHIQLQYGLKKAGLSIDVRHPVELLV